MTKLIIAASAIVGCLVLASILGPIVRRQLAKTSRPEAVREVAPVVGSFVFWVFVAVGIVVALSTASPESLKPLPGRAVAYFPKVLVAGVLLILGNVAGTLAALAIGRAALKASGARRPSAERMTKAAIVGLTAILAVAQLGVNTTVVNLLLAAMLFGLALSMALLVGLGGRDMARHVAAGRYLRTSVQPGDRVLLPTVSGEVVRVRAASVEVRTDSGEHVHVPFAVVMESPLRIKPAGEVTGG